MGNLKVGKLKRWYVVSMDEGILRSGETMREVMRWCEEHSTGAFALRRRLPGELYEYWIGSSAEDGRAWTIGRGDVVRDAGWDPDQTPLFPHADMPHERVERES